MADKTVENYIAKLPEGQAELVREVRQIILKAAPEAEESIKWAQPVYAINGPFAYIKAFKNSVNFGFWRGANINDPDGLLQGSGEKMRHIKLNNLKDINLPIFSDFVQQAVQLNLAKGDPTKG
ncbi:MAG: DUF1801 domain-containing protein [Anaerolineales bacterium]|jgi:hypothetical protein